MNYVQLRSLLSPVHDVVRVDDPDSAKLISVRLHGRGAVRRVVGDGKAPKPFTGNRGRSGHFVYSRIWCRRGAMALIPPELDGVVVTNEFPIFGIHTDKLVPEYLNHWVQTPAFLSDLDRVSRGASGQNRVKEAEFLSLSIPLPSLAEQRRVADILNHADALRLKRTAAQRQRGELVSAIFSSLFGDPVLNSKSWPMRNFGDLTASMQYGPRFYNESYSLDGIRIVRITDLDQAGHLDFGSMPRMGVTADEETKYGLTAGDIIFARTGATVGKLALLKEDDPPCIAGAYFIRVRLKDCLEPEYAAAFLRSRPIQAIIKAGSYQSAQQNFSGPGLRALQCPLPPIGLQREFSQFLAELEDDQALTVAGASALDVLFASLQSRAFSGQL